MKDETEKSKKKKIQSSFTNIGERRVVNFTLPYFLFFIALQYGYS